MVDGSPNAAEAGPGTTGWDEPAVWGDCEIRSSDDVELPEGSQCGTLTVPVDWNNPGGDTTDLALIRIPATGDKIGSLVINPGGPGESGVQITPTLYSLLPPDIKERYDFVGFDPRGVAGSSPALWCNSDQDNDASRADPMVDYSPEGIQHIENENKAFIQRCVDKMGEEFLANIGTVSVAKDLDAIRAALGDEKLTYLGYSYGTRIGATYAELFPQNVGRMILDGAIDPNADPVEANVLQAQSFQEAFDDYAADCATNPSCPLGTDPSKAVEVYKSLVDPLVTNPVPTIDPRNLGYSDALVGTIWALYSPNLWRHLTQALTEVSQGSGDTLLTMSDLYMGRDANGNYTNSTDARVAVNCVDKPAITDRAVLIEQDRRVREAAPFMNYGSFTGNAPLGTCAFWPVPPTSQPHELSVPNLVPTLVVSVTGDPATPYQAGVELADQLGGGLLTFEGTQHTVVFQGEECVDTLAADYLINGTLPPPDTRC